MRLRHKVRIYSVAWTSPHRRLWYVNCTGCDWTGVDTPHVWPDGRILWGRPSFDAVLAHGIAHQKKVCTS